MKIYLIDYENKKKFDNYIPNPESSQIYLFYTNNANTIDINLIAQLPHINYIKAPVGSQSLDMCLATYLGALIKENPEDEYIIISSDHHFDHIVNFWRSREIKIRKADCLSENAKHNVVIMKTLLAQKVEGKIVGKIASTVARTYKQPKAKRIIYLQMLKDYGKKDGLKYYGIIRDVI